jgi:hypothetical protein
MLICFSKKSQQFQLFFFFLVTGLLFLYAGDNRVQPGFLESESARWDITRKAPYLIYNGNGGQMEVYWQLTTTQTCTIEWGTDTNYSTGSSNSSEYGSSHQHKYTIGNLNAGSKYYYRVTAGTDVHTGSFYCAPSAYATHLKFFVYGDTRSHPENHDKVAEGMLNEIANDPGFQTFILSVGDLVYKGDSESYWDSEFFDADYTNIINMLAQFPYLSCRGNHEESGTLFKKYFPYPYVASHYWSFDYGPAHFVIIDQYIDYSTGSTQYDWIDNDLASSTKPWKFIDLHEPGWSAGGHSNEEAVQDYIQPLCEKYNVSIVFGGHNHYYARAEVNNVMHVTTGGGGAPLYTPDPSFPNIVATAEAYHYCKIELDDNMLYFSVYDDGGTRIDTFSIEKNTNALTRESSIRPAEYTLKQNYPNPFNPETIIEFSILKSDYVTLKVFNALGEEISTLVESQLTPGHYKYSWNGNGYPSGVYFYQLKAGRLAQVKKMMLLR